MCFQIKLQLHRTRTGYPHKFFVHLLLWGFLHENALSAPSFQPLRCPASPYWDKNHNLSECFRGRQSLFLFFSCDILVFLQRLEHVRSDTAGFVNDSCIIWIQLSIIFRWRRRSICSRFLIKLGTSRKLIHSIPINSTLLSSPGNPDVCQICARDVFVWHCRQTNQLVVKAGLLSRSRKESEIFGWSGSRISFCPTPYAQLDHFLQHTLNWEFLLKSVT